MRGSHQWHCISNLSVSTTDCWRLVFSFFGGKTKKFPCPFDCSRLQLAMAAKHCSRSLASERWVFREGTGIPRETRSIWRQKKWDTDFWSGGRTLEEKQLHRWHTAASEKCYHDKVKVGMCVSLAKEKDWGFFVFKGLTKSEVFRHLHENLHAIWQIKPNCNYSCKLFWMCFDTSNEVNNNNKIFESLPKWASHSFQFLDIGYPFTRLFYLSFISDQLKNFSQNSWNRSNDSKLTNKYFKKRGDTCFHASIISMHAKHNTKSDFLPGVAFSSLWIQSMTSIFEDLCICLPWYL